MQSNKTISWLSIALLWVGLFLCYSHGILSEGKVIAGSILVIVTTATAYWKYEIGAKLALFVLLLGVLNLIAFSPYKVFFGIEVGGIAVGVEFIALVLGAIHYILNREVLSSFVNDLFNRQPTPEEQKLAKRRRIMNFKNRLESKSASELQAILSKNELIPEALLAAKELLEEKMNSNSDSGSTL